MTSVLGINAFHGDASSCIVIDGRIIAAAEEERFTRVKHWAGFPARAIMYCLEEAGMQVPELDYVAINQNSRRNMGRRLSYVAKSRPSAKSIVRRLGHRRNRASIPNLLGHLGQGAFQGEFKRIEHHQCHVSSAFHVSPFTEATVVSLDGFGDFASGCWGRGDGQALHVSGRIFYPHSLGVFYQAMTQWLGFPHYGDEYKVMGLAPYGRAGRERCLEALVRIDEAGKYELDLEYFASDSESTFNWQEGAPYFPPLYSSALLDLIGPARSPDEPLTDEHRDVAYATQKVFEEAVFAFLCGVYETLPNRNLAYAGGCAMNSVANGKIRERTPFRQVYIPSAAGDAGGAVGAALSVWAELSGDRPSVAMDAYWGPHFTASEIERVITLHSGEIDAEGCTVELVPDEDRLASLAAHAISSGSVVGWFQGRMEWGPRALGNRSILCDPRNPDMKALLNSKIKRRESFRPFAPSILREEVGNWFEQDDDVPFMMQVFKIRAERQAQVPAVTHVDGTGRLHTVTQEANGRYAAVIREFMARTGVPMVLNTSFNENEPVVCRPEEALETFLRTRMDVLFLGDWMLTRPSWNAGKEGVAPLSRTAAGSGLLLRTSGNGLREGP